MFTSFFCGKVCWVVLILRMSYCTCFEREVLSVETFFVSHCVLKHSSHHADVDRFARKFKKVLLSVLCIPISTILEFPVFFASLQLWEESYTRKTHSIKDSLEKLSIIDCGFENLIICVCRSSVLDITTPVNLTAFAKFSRKV